MKTKMNKDTEKDHTNHHHSACARTDKELFRVCPSKLSKRELEDLYFALLESNTELKKNLNSMQEKYKAVSAKVQRMNAHKNGAGKDSPVTKAIVNEQKDNIIQLKRANDRMAERIRVLNMRLCSAKQFLGKSPYNSNIRATNHEKNSSANGLNPKSSNPKVPSRTQDHSGDRTIGITTPKETKIAEAETETKIDAEHKSSQKDVSNSSSDTSCGTRCKIAMEGLNEKIADLKQELATSQRRIEMLESHVAQLHGENQTVRGERLAGEHALEQRDSQLDSLKEKMRNAEAKYNEMNMELTIEKKKVAELETELKLAEKPTTDVFITLGQEAAGMKLADFSKNGVVLAIDKNQIELDKAYKGEIDMGSPAVSLAQQPATSKYSNYNQDSEDRLRIMAHTDLKVLAAADDEKLLDQEKIVRGEVNVDKLSKPKEDEFNVTQNEFKMISEKPIEVKLVRSEVTDGKNAINLSSDEEKILKVVVQVLNDDVIDDSGFTESQDLNKSIVTEKEQLKKTVNEELLDRLELLQSQLDVLKKAAAGEADTNTGEVFNMKPAYKTKDVKTQNVDNIPNQLNEKKEKPTECDFYLKPNDACNLLNKTKKRGSISSQQSKYKPYDVKNDDAYTTASSQVRKEKPNENTSGEVKTKEADKIPSQVNQVKPTQFNSYDVKETDNILGPINKVKPMQYESFDLETAEYEDAIIPISKNKLPTDKSADAESKESDNIDRQQTKLTQYESIDVVTNEADNILTNLNDAVTPKFASYDVETKESDDMSNPSDKLECFMEVKSAAKRNSLKCQVPTATNDTGEDAFDDFVTTNGHLANGCFDNAMLKEKDVIKPPRPHDDINYEISRPTFANSDSKCKKDIYKSDQSPRKQYNRKSIDDNSDKSTDVYTKRPSKGFYKRMKQAGSIGDSTLKLQIDQKAAKSRDSYGMSLRKKSIEEKSEKIRKTFQQLPEDNRAPFGEILVPGERGFQEKTMTIKEYEEARHVSKDPLETRPSRDLAKSARDPLSEEYDRTSERPRKSITIETSKDTLPEPYDGGKQRLSLSSKTTTIIKDYARDVEAKSRKVKPRFNMKEAVSAPSAPNPIMQPRESILVSRKSKDYTPAVASPYLFQEVAANVGNCASMSFAPNIGSPSAYVPPPAGGELAPPRPGNEPSMTAYGHNDDPFEICASSATVCRCPAQEHSGVTAFRTCSGNLRFRTERATDNIKHCTCPDNRLDCYDNDDATAESNRRDSGTLTGNAAKTYSVPDKYSRATSPDNTDHEISSMTDWPTSSKDGQKTPRSSFARRGSFSKHAQSPGEERGTMTASAQSDPCSFVSEGEVPGGLSSLGEKDPGIGIRLHSNVPQRRQNSAHAMEATLQTIGEELARCRRLLLSQRGQEAEGRAAEGLALHRAAGARQLSDSYAPGAVFTLHIGTLVLSDEAVVWSRTKNLVLTWKFFSHSAAVTRVQPGRVAIFDFVTEYDLTFNDDLLNYMKNSEMAIGLSELGKEEEPFAKCWLPLRDALIHANRRADMSLALLSCKENSNADALGEEIGVLDLWCSLRTDGSLPAMNRGVVHRPSFSPEWPLRVEGRSESRLIRQAADDETSRESRSSRVSRDFALGKAPSRIARALSMTLEAPRRSYSEYPTSIGRNFYEPGQDVPYRAAERYTEETQEKKQQLPKYNFHSFSSEPPIYPPIRRQSSGVIVNEVPANIRTDDDMREALEQKVQRNSDSKWPKMDDDDSLKHSSLGSMRSLAARHQLAKLKYPQTNKYKQDYVKAENPSFPNKDKQYLSSTMEGSVENFRRVVDPNKFIGVPGINKLAEASRKSVKYTDAGTSRETGKGSTEGTQDSNRQTIDITILWLALNEECEAMANPNIKRLYVAYSFLGRQGADLETPFSLPKPKHYADKCYFNFKRSFHLHESELIQLAHMARCRSGDAAPEARDCVVFTLVSEPPEDPLGLASCEDVGYAYLYLGDVLAYSGGSSGYTEVIGVRGVRGGVCGVLAVRVDNLPALRLCMLHSASTTIRGDLAENSQ